MYTIAQLKEMDETTLRQLNRDVVTVIRNKVEMEQRRAANKFRLGDKATFRDKTGRTVVMEITKFNSKTVGGVELGADGRKTFRNWRVAPSLLSPIKSAAPSTPGAGGW